MRSTKPKRAAELGLLSYAHSGGICSLMVGRNAPLLKKKKKSKTKPNKKTRKSCAYLCVYVYVHVYVYVCVLRQ